MNDKRKASKEDKDEFGRLIEKSKSEKLTDDDIAELLRLYALGLGITPMIHSLDNQETL